MSTSDVRRRIAEQREAADAGVQLEPCHVCAAPTDPATLGALGRRCRNCWDAWRNTLPEAPDVGNQQHQGPKAWAHALKAREERGERLSAVQREMWRDALRANLTPNEESDR